MKKFGRNLPLKDDPDPSINYEPHSINNYPADEREGERERRAAFDHNLYQVISSQSIYTTVPDHNIVVPVRVVPQPVQREEREQVPGARNLD